MDRASGRGREIGGGSGEKKDDGGNYQPTRPSAHVG